MGGPAGAYAGAKAGGAAGGVGQAVNEDRGLLGTAMAGISGYGIGSLGASIGAAGQNLATNIGTRAAGQTAGQAARQSIQNSFFFYRSGHTSAPLALPRKNIGPLPFRNPVARDILLDPC